MCPQNTPYPPRDSIRRGEPLGGGEVTRWSTLVKGTPESSLAPPTLGGHSKRMAVYEHQRDTQSVLIRQ